MQVAMARLEWIASEPPRRMVALPDFRHRLAGSDYRVDAGLNLSKSPVNLALGRRASTE